MRPIAYQGNAGSPWAPAGPGWRSCAREHDPLACQFAQSGALGALPLYHYTDELLPTGYHRFFAFETPHGPVVAGYKYEGVGTLGDLASDCTPGQIYIPSPDPLNPDMGLCVDVPPPGQPPAPPPPPAPPGPPSPPPPPAGGATTPFLPPPTDAVCSSWVADATNPQAVAIANQILDGKGPVPWTDQGHFVTPIAGVQWGFTMNVENGVHHVTAWRCTGGPGSTPTPSAPGGTPGAISSSAGGSNTGLIVAALALLGLGTGAVIATRRKRPA